MLISLDAKTAYLSTLIKAQAFIICGENDERCDTAGIQEQVNKMYAAKMMYDEGSVLKHVYEINDDIDNRLKESNKITVGEVFKFIAEMHDESWMHQKMEEMSSKLSQIQQTQARMESKTEAISKPKPFVAFNDAVPPKTKAAVPPEAKADARTVDAPAGTKMCKNCKKYLNLSEFNSYESRPNYVNCKKCDYELRVNKRIKEVHDSEDFRKLETIVANIPKGTVFTASSVALKIGDNSYNSSRTVKLLKHIAGIRVAPGEKRNGRNRNSYIKQ